MDKIFPKAIISIIPLDSKIDRLKSDSVSVDLSVTHWPDWVSPTVPSSFASWPFLVEDVCTCTVILSISMKRKKIHLQLSFMESLASFTQM